MVVAFFPVCSIFGICKKKKKDLFICFSFFDVLTFIWSFSFSALSLWSRVFDAVFNLSGFSSSKLFLWFFFFFKFSHFVPNARQSKVFILFLFCNYVLYLCLHLLLVVLFIFVVALCFCSCYFCYFFWKLVEQEIMGFCDPVTVWIWKAEFKIIICCMCTDVCKNYTAHKN